MEVKYRIIEARSNNKTYFQAQMYRLQKATWFRKEKEIFDTFGDWYDTFEDAKKALDEYRFQNTVEYIKHEIE